MQLLFLGQSGYISTESKEQKKNISCRIPVDLADRRGYHAEKSDRNKYLDNRARAVTTLAVFRCRGYIYFFYGSSPRLSSQPLFEIFESLS